MDSPSKDIHININTGTIFRFFLIAVLLVALYFISDVVLIILAAVILASAIEPVVRRLKRRGVHRIITVVTIYVVAILTMMAVFVFFVPSVMDDIASFLSTIPTNISLQDIWNPVIDVGSDTQSVATALAEKSIPVTEYLREIQSLVTGTGASAFKTASALFGGFLSFLLIVVISFYLAVKEEGVDDFLRIITPVKHHAYINDLWKRSQRKIALWLQGQVILSIIVGLLVYLVLIIVGVPHALVLALLAASLEIIPVFGPIIAAIPAVAVAFSTSGLGTSVLVLGLYAIIHQFESQLFYPLVVRKVVGISPIVVILALIIGAKLAGVLGALIAVPLSAALMEYIHDIEKYKKLELAERAVGKGE